MELIRLQGWTAAGRTETIASVKDVVGRAGWLLDSTIFSSKAVMFSCEISTDLRVEVPPVPG